MSTPIPRGHIKIRTVKPLEFAREQFAAGAILILDEAAAAKLIREKAAVAVELPAPENVESKACPQCGQPIYPVCGHVASR